MLGNPTNPTGVLREGGCWHCAGGPGGGGRRSLPPTRRPTRPVRGGSGAAGCAGAAASPRHWALAGLRVGYALGDPELLARLGARRPHCPLGTLQLGDHRLLPRRPSPRRVNAGEIGTCGPTWWLAESAGHGRGRWRRPVRALRGADAALMETSGGQRIAVRRCDTFVGREGYLRAAVRPGGPVLVARGGGGVAMSAAR